MVGTLPQLIGVHCGSRLSPVTGKDNVSLHTSYRQTDRQMNMQAEGGMDRQMNMQAEGGMDRQMNMQEKEEWTDR